MFEIVDSNIVYAGQENTDRQSCAFPGICVLPNGRWICAFRAAPTKESTLGQMVLITFSDDQGRTWSQPVAPFTPPNVDGKPGLFRGAYLTALGANRLIAAIYWVDCTDPSLPFFNEETGGLLDSRIFLAWSEDGGVTWSEPSLMDTSPFNVPTAVTGPVLCLPNGELAAHFETHKHYYDASASQFSSVMMFSADGGRTWPEHVITSSDPAGRIFFWDQRPGILADGTILDLFWTYDDHDSKYLNIHARRSRDCGRTWSEIWDTGVPGQPAQPVSTTDGGVAMVYVDRTNSPAIKLRTSDDGGMTWPEESEVTLHGSELPSQTLVKRGMRDAWAELSRYSVGLPATAPLPDGNILVVYYAGPDADRTDIRWCLLKAQA